MEMEEDKFGGIVGATWVSDTITIENCYNTGTIDTKGSYIGSLIGLCRGVTLNNCYWTTTQSGLGSDYRI